MDQRQTFDNNHELLRVVTAISEDKLMASFLIDNNGLTRVEGLITSVIEGGDVENTRIIIDNSHAFLLKVIIGINGLFRADYSEC